jgi:hypothetical protein
MRVVALSHIMRFDGVGPPSGVRGMSWKQAEERLTHYLAAFLLGGVAGILITGLSWLLAGRPPPGGWLSPLALSGSIFGTIALAIYIIGDLFRGSRPTSRPTTTSPVSNEQRNAFFREAGWPAGRGAVIGIALGLGALWLKILPAARDWHDVVPAACIGLVAGGYLGSRPVALKYGPPMGYAPDDLLDAATFGGLVGAAVGVLTVAALGLVIDGSYDSADTVVAAIVGGLLGASINVWRRCMQFKRFPRTRVVICAVLSAIAGAGFVWGILIATAWSEQKELVAFWTGVGSLLRNVSADQGFFFRAVTAVGALLGLGTYLWWQFGRAGRPSFRIRWSGAGSALDAIVETTPKLVSFTRGLLWTMLAVIVWRVASWWWSNFGVPGTISELVGYMIYGGAGVALWKGLVELRTALKGKPTLQNEGVHGGARDATPDEAHRAARGIGGQSSIDDRRFRV